MAFIVETGSGVVGANSFVSLADAQIIAERLNMTGYLEIGATSSDGDTAKERALMQATRYLCLNYRFPGSISNNGQGLSWPRMYARDRENRPFTGVPSPIREATVFLASKGPDALFGSVAGGVQQNVKREKVGSLEVEYENVGSPTNQPFFAELSALMAQVGGVALFQNGGGGMQRVGISR